MAALGAPAPAPARPSPHPRPPPTNRELTSLINDIAACMRDVAANGGGPTPVASRMRSLLPQLLGTCVEADGTAAGVCVRCGGACVSGVAEGRSSLVGSGAAGRACGEH